MRVAMLLIVLLASACTTPPHSTFPDSGTMNEPISFLALGDSYTIGEAVDPDQRWTEHLARQLQAEGIALQSPTTIATTGWTTDELDRAITAEDPQGPYGLVSLLIGVNNQYRGRSAEAFAPEFAALLERAVGLAGGDARRVVVLAIPDWGVTPFGAASGRDLDQVARELDDYNRIVRDTTLAHGAGWVDTAQVSRAIGATAVADDGLHPSGELYAEWARLATPLVRERLTR